MAAEDFAQAAAPRARKSIVPAGFTQTERKVATLYPPVDPTLMAGLLSNPNMPLGFGMSNREVRVRYGKIELWEKTQS